MVIFCVYTHERAKKPPNSEEYPRIEKNLRTIQKKSSRLFFSLYVYVYAQRNHSLRWCVLGVRHPPIIFMDIMI